MQDDRVLCSICHGEGCVTRAEDKPATLCPKCRGCGHTQITDGPPPVQDYDAARWPLIEAPAVVRGVPNEVYHAHPFLSASDYKAALRSLEHFDHQRAAKAAPGGTPSTRTFDLGHAVHLAVFEPVVFEGSFEVKLDGRTKEGKAQAAAIDTARAAGQPVPLLLSEDELNDVRAMAFKVLAHPAVVELLSRGGQPELSVLSPCAERVRPDWWGPGLILDLKTTSDASPAAFARSVVHWGYHTQAALYVDVITEVGDSMAPGPDFTSPPEFYWIAVEKTAPFSVAVYHATEATLNAGRAALAEARERLSERRKPLEHRGYSAEPIPLILPRWA